MRRQALIPPFGDTKVFFCFFKFSSEHANSLNNASTKMINRRAATNSSAMTTEQRCKSNSLATQESQSFRQCLAIGFVSMTRGRRPAFSSFSFPMCVTGQSLPPWLSSVLLNTVCRASHMRLILFTGWSLCVCSTISMSSMALDGAVQQHMACEAAKNPR